MEAYERIIPEAATLLRAGRPLALELGYGQEEPVCALLRESGEWEKPGVEPDYRGIPRVLSVRRASPTPRPSSAA